MITRNKYWKNRYKRELSIAILVVLLPFLIYIHLLFDRTNNGLIEILGFTYRHGYKDASIFIWIVLSRAIPIILFTVWYCSCNHSWRYFIIIPLAHYAYLLVVESFLWPSISNSDEHVMGICFAFGIVCIITLVDIKTRKGLNKVSFMNLSNEFVVHKEYYEALSAQLEKVKQFKEFEYSARLLFLKRTLKDIFSRSALELNEGYFKANKTHKFFIIIGLLVVPILSTIHEFVPKDLDKLETVLFTIDDNGFADLRMYLWFLCLKLCAIIPLGIWFYTARNWWRYSILSPLILYCYQFWEANMDTHQLDAYGNMVVFPFVFIIILIVLLISNAFKYRYGILDIYYGIQRELEFLIEKAVQESIVDYKNAKKLSIQKDLSYESGRQQRLKNLIELKDKISLQLKSNS